MQNDKRVVFEFLARTPLAVISTIDALHKPEAALIAFVQLPSFELIFETFTSARKYTNLEINPEVALVMGCDGQITVQYEGVSSQVPPDDMETYRNIFKQKETPCSDQYLLDSRARLFMVRPTWIRYSDYTTSIPKIIELSFHD